MRKMPTWPELNELVQKFTQEHQQQLADRVSHWIAEAAKRASAPMQKAAAARPPEKILIEDATHVPIDTNQTPDNPHPLGNFAKGVERIL